MYLLTYNNLCLTKKQAKPLYSKGSGLHKHHIIPRHAGGSDIEENFTYLTVREHIIAHFLLWKIYRNPNDLRSMHMLGANLSPTFRRITGEFCRDNKLGFHKASKEERTIWQNKGHETQKQSGSKDTFYWWSTKEGRTERARRGGSVSCKTNTAFIEQQGSFKDSSFARTSGLKAAKKPVTNGSINRRLYTEEERQKFLNDNADWRVGTTRKSKLSSSS